MIRDKQRLKDIKQMKADGMSNDQIATHYDRSRTRIDQLLLKVDDEAKLQEMADLRDSGWKLGKLAKHFNMDIRRVSEWLSQYEFPRRKCIYCGAWFVPTSAIRDYDSYQHKRLFLAALGRYFDTAKSPRIVKAMKLRKERGE